VNRRGMLRLIGMAPVAAPVAAKQAAVSMGLRGLGSAAAAGAVEYAGTGRYDSPVPCPPTPMEHAQFLKERLAEMLSPESIARYRQEAKGQARMLDTDIAAMRSISPSAAYEMQLERLVQARIKQERQWIEQSMQKMGIVGAMLR